MKVCGHKFEKICKYSDCYRKKSINNYMLINTKIKEKNYKNGVYFFKLNDKYLYVGESHTDRLSERIKQHFCQGDTGGLRQKLNGNIEEMDMLEKSVLYCYFHKGLNMKDIKYLESKLIGTKKPLFNFHDI